jgi:hypothetical protein
MGSLQEKSLCCALCAEFSYCNKELAASFAADTIRTVEGYADLIVLRHFEVSYVGHTAEWGHHTAF